MINYSIYNSMPWIRLGLITLFQQQDGFHTYEPRIMNCSLCILYYSSFYFSNYISPEKTLNLLFLNIFISFDISIKILKKIIKKYYFNIFLIKFFLKKIHHNIKHKRSSIVIILDLMKKKKTVPFDTRTISRFDLIVSGAIIIVN